jgi:hypothetical protein
VEGLYQALKSSEGAPLLDLSFDPESRSVGFSAILQKNKGSKQRPELEEVGKQEASCFARFESFPDDTGFSDLPEAQRLIAREKLEDQKRLCLNGLFLLKAIKSFAREGSRLSFQWTDFLTSFPASREAQSFPFPFFLFPDGFSFPFRILAASRLFQGRSRSHCKAASFGRSSRSRSF